MFELYDSLRQSANSKFEIETLKTNIASLDGEGQTIIFCLIYYHYKIKNASPPKLEENVTIDLTELPEELRNILHKFSQLHLQKMNEHFERFSSNK